MVNSAAGPYRLQALPQHEPFHDSIKLNNNIMSLEGQPETIDVGDTAEDGEGAMQVDADVRK